MGKATKKIRRTVEKTVEKTTKKDFTEMAELVCQMSFRSRLKIAWLIVKGESTYFAAKM